MSGLFDRLFQVQRLSTGAGDAVLEFAHDVPAWAWVLIALAAFSAALWSYSRLIGARWARLSLGALRALLLLLVAVLLAGPQLSRAHERREQDWVVFLVDRSESLGVTDAPGPDGARVSREEELRRTLAEAEPALKRLAGERHVLFLGFDAAAYDLKSGEDGVPAPDALGDAAGRRTRVGAAIEQTLRRVAARPVAGIVLLSDGRSSDTLSRATLRQLEARQIGVYPVALGSDTPVVDLAVAQVDAPRAAFVDDLLPVNVRIDTLGDAPEGSPGTGVQLVDNATGRVLMERRLEPGGPKSQRITLTAHPEVAGEASWSVRLVPDLPDLSPRNNEAAIRIALADRPIRVALFDGYPRWEYRYLKNLLLREASIESVSMLMNPQRRYIQEGTRTLDALPRTLAGWGEFDVIILGDLRPELFSDEQLAEIKELVAQRGAGVLWLAGAGAMPGAWRSSALADLLPFTFTPGSSGSAGPDPFLEPVTMRPAPAAERLGVLQLGASAEEPWPAELTNPDAGWTLLRWAQRIDPSMLKPTAEVLALAQPVSGAPPLPLVLTMRYGAGRVVYVGTDEVWRYRYARGETLPERFWLPLVRLLARDSLGRSGKPALLSVEPERAQPEQQVRVVVRLLDQSLLERKPPQIVVSVTPKGAARGSGLGVTLRPEAGPDAAERGVYSGAFVAGEPGVYQVTSADPILAGADAGAELSVVLADEEMRVPQSDHAALADIARQTGGQVLRPGELSALSTILPNRELRISGTPEVETLWDKPVVWLTLMVLLTLEWAGRRLIKLS